MRTALVGEVLVGAMVGQIVGTLVSTRYSTTDRMDPFRNFVKRLAQLLLVRQNEVTVLSKLDVKVRILESFEAVPETELDLSTRDAFRRSVQMDLWGSSAWTQARGMDQEGLVLGVTIECYQYAQ